MARRVSDTFTAGMITDVVGASNSVHELADMYVRRGGELACRGPVVGITSTLGPSAHYHAGWSQANFHPNMGTGACRGSLTSSATEKHINNATHFHIVGAPLQAVSQQTAQSLAFSMVSEGASASEIPLHAGAASAATAATGLPVERVVQMTNAGEEMIMAGEIGSLYKWGGSLYAPYKVGTVAIASASASASRIVTGTGTTFGANVQEGQYILMDGIAEKANTLQRAYRITKVVDNTHLEIELPIYATAGFTGIAYRIQSCAVIQSPDGVWNQTNERPTQVGVCCYHQGKLFTAGIADNKTAYNTVFNYDGIRWSGTLDENKDGFSHLDLWHSNATIDIFPGIGGSIRGLVSMGNELVVIKSHGMFRVTGAATYDGTGAGMAVQIISTEVGAAGFNAWTLTSRGLVIACRDGLYLYDGEEVSSLTDGRIKRWWEANYPNYEFCCSNYEDKVIVTPVYWSALSGNKLVWDAEQNLFWTMTTVDYEYVAGVSTYTQNDEFVGDYMFSGGAHPTRSTGNNKIAYQEGSHVNHKKGWDSPMQELAGAGQDFESAFMPSPAVLTQPFPLGEDQLGEGRINNILVHAALTPTASLGIATYILTGSSYTGITNLWSQVEHAGEEYTVAGGLVAATATDTDRVHRIPVEDMDAAPCARILLDGNVALGSSAAGIRMRIYSIGVDYRESNVQGSPP